MGEGQEKNIRSLLIIFFVLVLTGTLGFTILKEISVWTAFYETMHLMLSHFYDYGGEHEPPLFQALTLMLVSGSLIIVVYFFKIFGEYLLGGQLKKRLRKKNMHKTISKLKDHYIICGYGRVGRQVAEELASEGDIKFVVIDKDKDSLKKADKRGFLYIHGDPTLEENLQEAGVKTARGLISVLDDDTDNLFLTIAARGDNPDIFIVARVNNEENISKFEKAGTDRVALPYKIGGYHIATMALRPSVIDFLDIIVDGKHDELQVEEIVISSGSKLIGQMISSSKLSRDKTKTTVLAINKEDGRSLINPPGKYVMDANDKLIILGTKDNLDLITESMN